MALSLVCPAPKAPYHCCVDGCLAGSPFYEFRQENTHSPSRWSSSSGHWYTHLCQAHLDELRRPGEFAKPVK